LGTRNNSNGERAALLRIARRIGIVNYADVSPVPVGIGWLLMWGHILNQAIRESTYVPLGSHYGAEIVANVLFCPVITKLNVFGYPYYVTTICPFEAGLLLWFIRAVFWHDIHRVVIDKLMGLFIQKTLMKSQVNPTVVRPG
jgi:hypothetical protein